MSGSITRRRLIRSKLVGVLALFVAGGSRSWASGVKSSISEIEDGYSKTEWMEELFSNKASSGNFHLYRFADSHYALTKSIAWSPDKKDRDRLPNISVPIGFVTDFASIPRIFWSILPRDGRYTFPAVVHDYLYWTQEVDREIADEIFDIGMKEFDVGKTNRLAIYWAVRAAGWRAWNSNGKLKQNGEKRILSKLPGKPTQTWEEWKKDPNRF